MASRESISIGAVLSRGFAAIGSNPTTFFGIAFLLGGLPGMVLSALRTPAAVTPAGVPTSAYALIAVSSVINLLLYFVINGALVRATIVAANGGRSSLGESLGAGLRLLGPLIGLGIVFGLGVGFASVLLLVPGVILYVWWSVSVPVLVEERPGILASLGRSRALTKGARWRIFALHLLIFVALMIVSAVAGLFAIAGLRGGVPSTGTTLLLALFQAVVGTLWQACLPAITTSLYLELRDWKEGSGSEKLTEIFS